jgi:hypothetical protein
MRPCRQSRPFANASTLNKVPLKPTKWAVVAVLHHVFPPFKVRFTSRIRGVHPVETDLWRGQIGRATSGLTNVDSLRRKGELRLDRDGC